MRQSSNALCFWAQWFLESSLQAGFHDWGRVVRGPEVGPGLGCTRQGKVFALVVRAIEGWLVPLQAFLFTSKVISLADTPRGTCWDGRLQSACRAPVLVSCVSAPPHPTPGSLLSMLVFPGTCLVSSLALLPACLTSSPGFETQIERVYIYVLPNSSDWSSVCHFEILSLLITVCVLRFCVCLGTVAPVRNCACPPNHDLSVFALLFLLIPSLASRVACSEVLSFLSNCELWARLCLLTVAFFAQSLTHVFGSLTKSFVEWLNGTMFLVQLIFKDENKAAGVWVIPTSDPAANLHPVKPKDFSAFVNLVEFCRYS